MNQFYDEDSINEEHARELYYTIRDAVSQAKNAEIPLSMAGIAQGIADELNVKELTKLVDELDEQIAEKINNNAEIRAREYVNKGIDKLIGAKI